MRVARFATDATSGDETMSEGIPLLFLALGTLGGVWFLEAATRKQVANAKGDPARSNVIQDHGGTPWPNMEGTEH